MSPPLSLGPGTYTFERLYAVWREGRHAYDRRNRDERSGYENATIRSKYLERICRRMYAAVQDPIGHWDRIDDVFASFFIIKIPNTCFKEENEDTVVKCSHRLLSQLPARPPDILPPADLNTSAVDNYQSSISNCTCGSLWDRVEVVARVNTLILRFTIYIFWFAHRFGNTRFPSNRKLTNSIALLVGLAFKLSAEAVNPDEKRSWVVVKAFLWTSWQRVLMLHLWCHLRNQLQHGYSFDSTEMNLLGLTSIPDISGQLTLQEVEDRKKSPYLCSWAYELLRNERASVTTDMRHFHWCYRNPFGNLAARCKDGQTQCEGGTPMNCQRFKGAVVKNQSAHDIDHCDKICRDGSRRLLWDKKSFINAPGAKAVCLIATDDKYLRYRTASRETLAISHVWSHGQGGRPDERQEDEGKGPENEPIGLNACLHRRYAKLAMHFKCNSYWIDTACIPHEKVLRTECISNINKIFSQSAVTLVCDRDIMSIDITELTMNLRESILATVLVCDWNIRAWTLLEAMRGRNNIFLLCAGNQVLSLKKTLEAVCERGRIDLAILFLSAQHLLPAEEINDYNIGLGSMSSREDELRQSGFISLGEASILLSHRHATRDGDDIVIWSLLAHERAIKDVMELWKSQVGSIIRTGFLMSSAPRIQGQTGWSWAPSSPTLHLSPSTDLNQNTYLAYDGESSQGGLITSEGLQATWLVYEFHSTSDENLKFPHNVRHARRYLKGHRLGALLRPGQLPGLRRVPAPYPGRAKEPLIAICGSNDGQQWEWMGVYEWVSGDPVPYIDPFPPNSKVSPNDFHLRDIMLI